MANIPVDAEKPAKTDSPARHYDKPAEVVKDQTLTKGQKAEALETWKVMPKHWSAPRAKAWAAANLPPCRKSSRLKKRWMTRKEKPNRLRPTGRRGLRM